MKALILAAGTGKRLRPLTDSVPKPLIKIGTRTLLNYQLESLIKHGIEDVIITTGPFKEELEEHVRSNHRIKAYFVHNPRYETTNYIYSLWLTKNLIDSDLLLLHGDLLFDDVVMGKLLGAKDSRVLVNREIKPSEKDFNVLIEKDRITRIGVKLSGPNAYSCAPAYRLTRLDFLCWLDKIDDFIKQGKVSCYAEDAFNQISDQIVLRPLYFEEFCMEIDTPADLEKAKTWLKSERDKHY